MAAYHVGVVGAGNMGVGIAQKMAQEGLMVTLVDLNQEMVDRGLNIIKKALLQGVDRGTLKEEQMTATMERIHGTPDYEELKDMDLVVEAVFEDKKVKSDLLRQLDNICSPKTILATNTSGFYVKDLALVTERPDRVVGMHYFYPPAKNRLLEIITHEGTSEETIVLTDLIGKLHGKMNILVKDSPGFAVNRFFVPFLTSAVRILEEGIANIPTIEKAAKDAFSIGMGPFELMNVTGIPIAANSSDTLGKDMSEFYKTPDLLRKQADSKELWDLSGDIEESQIESITDYLYGVVLGVACEMVDEGVCSKEDCDRGAKIGLRWRFGPFELINRVGIHKIYRCVEAISKKYPGFPIAENLKKQADLGKPFEFSYVDMNIKNGIAYITLNRPEAMNALNVVSVAQLNEKFTAAEKDGSIKAIAFKGAGKSFVAGADIKFFIDNIRNNAIDKNVSFTSDGHSLLRRIETCKKPTVAIVAGLSLGGGSELALACQAIVGTEGASFGFPETGIGIYPGLGGMIRSARIIGKDLAKYYVLTGKTIRAKDAEKLGIITVMTTIPEIESAVEKLVASKIPDKYKNERNDLSFIKLAEVVNEKNLDKILGGEFPSGVEEDLAKQTISILKSKAPMAIKVVNELMAAQEKVDIDEAIKMELSRLTEIFSTEDALAGLSARPGDKVQFSGK